MFVRMLDRMRQVIPACSFFCFDLLAVLALLRCSNNKDFSVFISIASVLFCVCAMLAFPHCSN